MLAQAVFVAFLFCERRCVDFHAGPDGLVPGLLSRQGFLASLASVSTCWSDILGIDEVALDDGPGRWPWAVGWPGRWPWTMALDDGHLAAARMHGGLRVTSCGLNPTDLASSSAAWSAGPSVQPRLSSLDGSGL